MPPCGCRYYSGLQQRGDLISYQKELPDLISYQEVLAVRQQLKTDHHPKQGAYCKPQDKSRVGCSPYTKVNECTPATQSRQQQHPNGAWLRYYHIFKEGSLAELIEHHDPELHIIHSYFDHTNLCVIVEKNEVWRIWGNITIEMHNEHFGAFFLLKAQRLWKSFLKLFIALGLFWGRGESMRSRLLWNSRVL